MQKLSGICLDNAISLQRAVEWCAGHEIGAFRITSRLMPLATHPTLGYGFDSLPDGLEIKKTLRKAGMLAKALNIRLTFHPDQFVVLNSPHGAVLKSSIDELRYHSMMAEIVDADVITLHGGGVYSDRKSALARLVKTINRLPATARKYLALENDDKNFPPRDILRVCSETGMPMVYDSHHHRCLPDGLNAEEASLAAAATWKREPLFHISSPIKLNPNGKCDYRHYDFIRPSDFPMIWLNMTLTVEVEAKAGEIAVLRLLRWLKRGRPAPRVRRLFASRV